MGHFGVAKTLDVLHEHFYWPKMKRDVQRICEQCIACRKAKSRVQPHGLYTPLLFFFGKLTYVLKEEDTNIIRGIPQIYNDNRNIKQQMATG